MTLQTAPLFFFKVFQGISVYMQNTKFSFKKVQSLLKISVNGWERDVSEFLQWNKKISTQLLR